MSIVQSPFLYYKQKAHKEVGRLVETAPLSHSKPKKKQKKPRNPSGNCYNCANFKRPGHKFGWTLQVYKDKKRRHQESIEVITFPWS